MTTPQPKLHELKNAPHPAHHTLVIHDETKRVAPAEDGEANWLISYADLMTLLMGFFVIVSAFSTPNAEKIEKLKKATAEALDAEYVEPNHGLAESLAEVLRDFNLQDEIQIIATEEGLSLVSNGTLFFDTGSVDLKPGAQDLLERVGDVLVDKAGNHFKIFVEGHTDDAPIRTSRFASNWELSSGRSATVVRLFESRGYTHELLRPLGLADVEPSVPNRDEKGHPIEANRARNRRIVIRLQKHIPRRMPLDGTGGAPTAKNASPSAAPAAPAESAAEPAKSE